jgi:hypothetical protein
MSDSMDKAVWQAAFDGNEAELGRLIGLGGNVNWHNPDWVVRRRMCLAWAPASTPPLSSVDPAAPARHGAIFPTAQLHGARRTPACSPIRLTPFGPLRMARVCVQYSGDTALMYASRDGREGCVRLLIESGANVNDRNVCLERPLPSTRHGSASME